MFTSEIVFDRHNDWQTSSMHGAESCQPLWFHVYSPHRTRWPGYTTAQKQKLLNDHAATVFEDQLRALWPGSSRFWEAQAEFDLVREEPGGLIVGEIKWADLSKIEKKSVLDAGALRLLA